MLWHSAPQGWCCSIGRIGDNKWPPSRNNMERPDSRMMVPTNFYASRCQIYWGPTHRSCKPSSPPAIINTTEAIKGPLPHVSALQSVAGEEGETLTMTKIQPCCPPWRVIFGCCRSQDNAAALTMTTKPRAAVTIYNNQWKMGAENDEITMTATGNKKRGHGEDSLATITMWGVRGWLHNWRQQHLTQNNNQQTTGAIEGADGHGGARRWQQMQGGKFMAMMTKERQAPTPPLPMEEEDTAINHRRRWSKSVVSTVAKKKTSTTVPTARRRSPIVHLDVIIFGWVAATTAMWDWRQHQSCPRIKITINRWLGTTPQKPR